MCFLKWEDLYCLFGFASHLISVSQGLSEDIFLVGTEKQQTTDFPDEVEMY